LSSENKQDCRSWNDRPAVKVVSAVVSVPDLLGILRRGVENDIGDQVAKDIAKQFWREAKVGPVHAIFQNVEHVSLEVDLPLEIGVVSDLHGDLATGTGIFASELRVAELEIVGYRLAGKTALFVLAWAVDGHDIPVSAREGGRSGSYTERGEGREKTHAIVAGMPVMGRRKR
jgi:hypothetical protein